MKVRMLCTSIVGEPGAAKLVSLAALVDDANKSFSTGTPAGNLSLEVDSEEGLTFFQKGHAYDLDLTDLGAVPEEPAAEPAPRVPVEGEGGPVSLRPK